MATNHILVLDDDVTVCEAMRLIGVSCGYKVTSINTPQNLNTLYAELNPDIIILDLNLGKYDGVEVLRELSNLKSPVKIILISGHDEKVLHSALLLGCSKGLNVIAAHHKPVDANTLKALLKTTSVKYLSVSPAMIRAGIANNEFILCYQPKIYIHTLKFAGVEALIRWNVTGDTIIHPDSFISVAEQNDLIAPLSSWVNHEAVRQGAEFQKNGFEVTISINISSLLLSDLSLPDDFAKLTEKYGLKPENFCIEITESEAIKNISTTLDILTRFRLKGFAVSIDDFGTGFSSLVGLHRIPSNELKIDKSFILNLKKNTSEYVIVRSTIRLAHDLDLQVVAEGVETRSAFNLLKKLRCDIAQGYLIASPMPAEQLISWMRTNLDDSMTYKFPFVDDNKK